MTHSARQPPALKDISGVPARLSGALLAAWVATVLLLVYLMQIGGGSAGIYLAFLRATSVALAAAGLVVWGLVAVREPAIRTVTVLWPAIGLALLAMSLSTLTSTAPRVSLEYLLYAMLLAVLYAALVAISSVPALRSRLGAFAVLMCVTFNALYIVLSVGYWIEWWSMIGRIAAPPLRPAFLGLGYGNPSAVMTLSVLLLAPAVAYLGFSTLLRRLSVVMLAASTLIVVVLSGSRAGWLGVGLATVFTLLAVALTPSVRRRARGLLRRRSVLVLVALAGLSTVVAGAVLAPSILLRTGAGGEAVRGAFYAASTRMFLDRPITGQGVGTWPMRRMEFTVPPETDYYIPHAHNLYLQTLAELGLTGVVTGCLVIAALTVLIWRGVRDHDPHRRLYGFAALFSVAYFGAHQLLDFYPNFPGVLFAFVLPIAWLDATTRRSPRPARARHRVAGAGLAAAVTGAVVMGTVAIERAAMTHEEAVAWADEDRWDDALPLARAAASADPDMPTYQFTLALAEAWAGNRETAERALSKVAEADEMPIAWLNLAHLYFKAGRQDEGVEALHRSLRLGYQQPVVGVNAALMWLSIEDRQSAISAMTDAVVRSPTLAGDPFWLDEPARRDVLDHAVSLAIERSPHAAFAIALERQDWAVAVDRARSAGIDTVLADAVVAAWRGGEKDAQVLYDLARARPLEPGVVEWCARLASRRHDREKLEFYRRWGVIIQGPAGQSPGTVRTAIDPPETRVVVDDTAFYGQYTYRRAIPWDHVLPGMARLILE